MSYFIQIQIQKEVGALQALYAYVQYRPIPKSAFYDRAKLIMRLIDPRTH
jgi:hypothetical protein